MNVEAKYIVELSSFEFINILTSDYKRIANPQYMLWNAADYFFRGNSEKTSIDYFSDHLDEVIIGPKNDRGAKYMSILEINPREIDKDKAMSEYKRIAHEFYSLSQESKILIAGLLNISYEE
ncbi:hypothetical protein [Vibrio fluvialis]|uniref:hypothetical protein n=1 Tax=Vibrio fluvialis TaxID=676 RepID=UPI001EEBA541|nr:hypothetical protein [Vibrio fluvialis]MCG6366970.1 hypothetical protein [Vibrio fluvialis]MCG6375669.1 hypothetical protein [Vibrio fluvialis]